MKRKSDEDKLSELFDADINSTTKRNQQALNEEYDNMRDKFSDEYYINKNEKKARKIEDEYQSKTLQPMIKDLIKQKKEDERKKGERFSNLKRFLRGE